MTTNLYYTNMMSKFQNVALNPRIYKSFITELSEYRELCKSSPERVVCALRTPRLEISIHPAPLLAVLKELADETPESVTPVDGTSTSIFHYNLRCSQTPGLSCC